MSVSIEGSGSITGVSTFYNATFSGITTFADNINFDANIAGVTTFLGVGVTSLNVLGVSTFTGQLNAGTISATTVSIAGTLTYQDVTNVDSIGIVTARNGIHITGTDEELRIYRDAGDRFGSLRYDGGIFKLKLPTNDHFTVDDANNNERLKITSAGLVGISSATPKTDVDISQKTGAVALPQGTTAQRPSGSAPYIRKNTTNNALEYFDGTSWVEIITDYFPTGSTIFG